MPHVISFEPELLGSHCFIDVRTPLEFAEDSIPGAFNVPLLSNEERAEIGTLYKQDGPHPARIRGLQITAARFPALVAEIAALAAGRPTIVYCWRGGLRSKTVASILDLTGYDVLQLEGGYKAFRNTVTRFFDSFVPPGPLVVLHGHTGTGKTDLLSILATRGHAVVDLEGIACHRGSAFGEVGLSQSLTQKRFETLLWDNFRKIRPGTPIIVEGESRRIGKVSLPGTLYDVMKESVKIWCTASIETRVKRLLRDYARIEYREELSGALGRIGKKLGGEKLEEISGYLDRWEMEPFLRELMVSYYDRTYYRTRDWVEDRSISLEDYEAAADEIAKFVTMVVAASGSSRT